MLVAYNAEIYICAILKNEKMKICKKELLKFMNRNILFLEGQGCTVWVNEKGVFTFTYDSMGARFMEGYKRVMGFVMVDKPGRKELMEIINKNVK